MNARSRPKPIRASEIADFVFCEQAWWFRLQGYAPRNREQMQAGWAYHRAHERDVRRWVWVRRLAWSALLLGLALAGWALYLSWTR